MNTHHLYNLVYELLFDGCFCHMNYLLVLIYYELFTFDTFTQISN